MIEIARVLTDFIVVDRQLAEVELRVPNSRRSRLISNLPFASGGDDGPHPVEAVVGVDRLGSGDALQIANVALPSQS